MGTRSASAAVFAILALAAATSASANSVLNNSTNGGLEIPNYSWSQTAHGGTLSQSVDLGTQRISATSFAGFGKLSASTLASARDFGPYLGNSGIDRRGSNANASFEDSLTIFAGTPGSIASAVFAVRISQIGNIVIGDSPSVGGTGGNVDIVVYGAGSAGLRITKQLYAVTRAFDAQNHIITGIDFEEYQSGSPAVTTHLPHYAAGYAFDDIYLLNISFISGHAFTLVGSVGCGSSAATDALSPIISGDCSISQQWKGLRAVVDNGGHQITAFTTSGSGFNYGSFTPGVPEPESWAMLIAGFGLTGAVMRRRQVSPVPKGRI